MRHRNALRKLGRTSSHRWSMLRTMVSQLLTYERIETTVPKAKELRPVADNMITLAKDGTLHARRQAAAVVRGPDVLRKLFTEMAERYKERSGGYTRVMATRIRTTDAAPMAYIEFVDRPDELRQAKPGKTTQEQNNPLPPWLSAKRRQWAPPMDMLR